MPLVTADFDRAKLAWRFFGEGISSRRAEAVLQGTVIPPGRAAAAIREIKADLARRTGQLADDVFLFPSGMAAMASAGGEIMRVIGGRKVLRLRLLRKPGRSL